MEKCFANPRLTDAFSLPFTQDEVDFAVPRLKEDIPLCIDPFLLWASGDPTYRELHAQLLEFFEQVRLLTVAGRETEATRLLLTCAEAREFGFGYAQGSKQGSAVGVGLAGAILRLYAAVPQFGEGCLSHIEEIQLLVPGVAEDRISDLTASILKQFFLDFTVERASRHSIPTKKFTIADVWDPDLRRWRPGTQARLPYNPADDSPLLFAPLNVLRHLPWINYEDYYRSFYAPFVLPPDWAGRKVQKGVVLAYNRANYMAVQQYVREKERTGDGCKPDPLFEPLMPETLKRKLATIQHLPPGSNEGSDRKYEELVCDTLSSLLYPELEFAQSQVRTVSGTHIRDLVFYNDGKTEFLRDIRERFGARQIVFELKNVGTLASDHVNQLYRYLDDEFGRLGILVTRNPASKALLRNTVDLHSSKRCAILCLSDADLDLMVSLLESYRRPAEVLNKKFVEFTRLLPK